MAALTPRSGNLPAETTSFIGRRRELAEIRRKLSEVRLVSLVGPGGVGKTRLAIRVASDLRRSLRDGAWLVELADIRDAELVATAVMTALDLRDQTTGGPLGILRSYLRDKQLLLVLDNCEHLLDDTARLTTEVLGAAPDVRVLVTSREPLSVTGESVIPVAPLELPSAHAGQPLGQLRQNEAVTLLVERAAAASGTFELTAANQAAVVELCRRLDGLPLAIEMAAVRTRVLTVEQILERLSDRFSLLTGGSRAALPRHQTLRTTIEWSHDLLSSREQTLLRRLSVFAGKFTLEDVEAVCTLKEVQPAQVLDALSSLVDRSLVMKEDARSFACYRLHETMRDFADLKLQEAGEQDLLESRCDEYYTSRCRQSALDGRSRLPEWLAWAELEIDNVRAVLQRCLTRADITRGVDLAASLGWYWVTRATTEGIRWLDEFLPLADGDGEANGWGYFIRGFLAVLKAEPAAAKPALDRAVANARRTNDRYLLAEALSMASNAENIAGEHASAGRFLDEARAVAADLGNLPATLAVLQAEALNGFFNADLNAVARAAERGAHLAREAGDLYVLQIMWLNLGSATLIGGDLDNAMPILIDALRVAHEIDDRVAQFYLLDALGCHAAFAGDAERAAHLFGAAHTVRAGVGANVMPFLEPSLILARERAIQALGPSKFEEAFDAGRLLDRHDGVNLGLGESGDGADVASDVGGTGVLGRREAEVARLVADGLSNKQIGSRLFISERTVDSHVRNILSKLGFSSRAQVAAWMGASDQ